MKDVKHVEGVKLCVLTRHTTVRPVHDTVIVSERIAESQLLDRVGDEPHGYVGGKPARIDRVIARRRLTKKVPAQERSWSVGVPCSR